MNKKISAFLVAISVTTVTFAQVSNGVFKCKNDTYNLLREISRSVCSKGEILLSITTHQDLGWVDEVEKCIIMRDTLWMTPFLDRLMADKDFSMDIEQSSIVKEYIQRHPDRKAEIQKGLDEGRILVGATYTQPYEEMFSGESLVRQLYLGKKWLSANFNGYSSDLYYNSDVPGRTLQMPQILARAGVSNMFVSRHEKGVCNWYSPDSSKVTMFSSGHYIDFYNILGKESDDAVAGMAKEVLFWGNYYDNASKKVIIPALLNYEFIWDQKPVRNCDPFIRMWNSIEYIENEKDEKIKVNLPKFRYGNLNTCLTAIRENSSRVRNISGERPAVWLYIHGPSHHYAISASRRADIILPDAEKFASINSIAEKTFRNYDEQAFSEAWEAKIYPDHGWGGKGGEITDRLFLGKFVHSLDLGSSLLYSSLGRLASKISYRSEGTPVVVFNGLNWKRNDPVTFWISFDKGEAKGISLSDPENKPVAVQPVEAEYYDDGSLKTAEVTFLASDVPSTGHAVYYLRPDTRSLAPEKHDFTGKFENRFYTVQFCKGGIERLYDKTLKKDIVDASKFRLGEVFTMQSVGNGAGEFSDIQQPTIEGFDKTGNYETTWEMVSDGPVFTSFRFRQPVRYAVIEETVKFYKERKQIDFDIYIKNWQGILYREFRAAFPLNMTAPAITYEVPMGVVEVGKDELKGPAGNIYNTDCRLVHPRTLSDFVNISGNGFGTTISSSVIAFDYIDPTAGQASGTLIQPILMASRKSCHPEGNDYIQLGDHHFSFSLFTDEPGWKNGFHNGKQAQNTLYAIIDPVRSAETIFGEKQSYVNISGNEVLLTALKRSEDGDGIIMRVVDMSGRKQEAGVELFSPAGKVLRTNLIENGGRDTGLSGSSFSLPLEKNAIETIKLKFKQLR